MSAPAADLVITGGTVVRSARSGPAVPAEVAIRDGVVVAVGAAAADHRGPGTDVVDVAGAVLVPGLVDGHTHPVMGLDLTDGVDLTGRRTLPEVAAALAGHARSHPDAAFLVGFGLDPGVFGSRPLDNAAISAAVAGRPALVHLFDGHGAIATGAALAAAGITGPRPLPGGATIGVARDGDLTGVLLEEAAIQLVAGSIPLAPFDVRLHQLRRLLHDMAGTGLTGGHVMDARGDALALFAALDEQHELPLRLRVAPWCRTDDDVGELLEGQRRGGRMWSVEGVKMFLDGTIDGGTAWLTTPDSSGSSTTPGWDLDDFRDRLRTFDAAGVPVVVHAIGDAAVRFVLDTIASFGRRPGGPRHRIEHAETLPDDLVPRFAELGVAASMQPRHATDYTRADGTDNWSRRLGARRAARGWRCADVVAAGGVLVLGSDWPVAPYDARRTLAAAILRRPPDDPGAPPVQPWQAVSAVEALHACTAAPGWVAGDGTGRIAVGATADITVLAADPRHVPAGELGGVEVVQTISGGLTRLPRP